MTLDLPHEWGFWVHGWLEVEDLVGRLRLIGRKMRNYSAGRRDQFFDPGTNLVLFSFMFFDLLFSLSLPRSRASLSFLLLSHRLYNLVI